MDFNIHVNQASTNEQQLDKSIASLKDQESFRSMRRTRQKFHDTVEYLHGEIPERERRQTLSAMRG